MIFIINLTVMQLLILYRDRRKAMVGRGANYDEGAMSLVFFQSFCSKLEYSVSSQLSTQNAKTVMFSLGNKLLQSLPRKNVLQISVYSKGQEQEILHQLDFVNNVSVI
jgi:hypothetical protein